MEKKQPLTHSLCLWQAQNRMHLSPLTIVATQNLTVVFWMMLWHMLSLQTISFLPI